MYEKCNKVSSNTELKTWHRRRSVVLIQKVPSISSIKCDSIVVFRILLVGRTGHGKSSTCNTLIGEDVACVSSASTSTTTKCKLYTTTRFDRDLEIVDTPGIFDTSSDNVKIHNELIRALLLSAPGFHAIAFVLKRDKFTDEIQETTNIFFEWFGRNVKEYSFIILTDTSTKEEKTEYLTKRPHPKLSKLVSDCGERVVPLQNKNKQNRKGKGIQDRQVKGVLDMVEGIVVKNENKYFSNLAYILSDFYAKNTSKGSLSSSEVLLIEKEINELREENLSRIQKESFMYITGEEYESQTGSDVLKKTETKGAYFSKHVKGNLTIIDMSTGKQYDITESEPERPVSNIASETQQPVQDNNSINYSDCLDDISHLKHSQDDISHLKDKVNEDKTDKETKKFEAFVKRITCKLSRCTII